jgi:hypothetical protein
VRKLDLSRDRLVVDKTPEMAYDGLWFYEAVVLGEVIGRGESGCFCKFSDAELPMGRC